MRNLLMLTIIMALATVCVSAQTLGDKVTFSDYRNQSITVDQFGTVVKFINRDGKELLPTHTYRICPCNKVRPCFESKATNEARATLLVVYPVKGKELKEGQSLQMQATIAFGDTTVMRRLVWKAGSSRVDTQTLTFSRTKICCIEEESTPLLFFEHHGCSMPPPDGFSLSCPPPPDFFSKAPSTLSQHSSTFTLDFSLWPRNRL